MDDKQEQVLGRLSMMNGGTLGEKMGIEFTEVSAQRVVGRMPVAGNTQPFGLLHGGASVVLAESGFVTGTATALSLGRTLATYDVLIIDDDGNRICTSRITCLIRPTPPGA